MPLPNPPPGLQIPACFLLLGSLVGPAPSRSALLLVILCCTGASLLPAIRPLAGILVRCVIPLLVGILLAPGSGPETVRLPLHPTQVEGVVSTLPRARLDPRPGEPDRLRLKLELSQVKVDGIARTGRIRLDLPGRSRLGRGDRIRALMPAEGRFLAHTDLIEITPSTGLLSQIDRWRTRIRERLTAIPATGGWGAALLLGERRMLPASVTTTYRRTGLVHLLAISGLHVSIVLGIGWYFSRRSSGRTQTAIRLLALGAVLLQGTLAGGNAPVVRAAVTGIAATAMLLGTGPTARGAPLALAICVWCALGLGPPNPSAILSLAAVLGIHLATSRGDRGLQKGFLGRWRISMAAWLGAGTVIALWTPEVAIFSSIATLVMIPPIAGAIGMSAVTALTPDLLPEVQSIVWTGLRGWLETLPRWIDELPGTPWLAPPVGPLSLSLAHGAGLALLLRRHRLALLLAIVGLLSSQVGVEDSIELITPGRGQALLLCAADGSVLLDAGSVDRPSGGAREIRNSMWRRGLAAVDLAILSHPHSDHVSAIPQLVRWGCVNKVALGPRFDEVPLGRAISTYLERHRIEVLTVAQGDRFAIGRWRLKILSPPMSIPSAFPISINDDSVVVAIDGPCGRIIVPGDLQGAGLASVRPLGPCDLLLLPHHGNPAPGLENWVRRLAPAQVIAPRPGAPPDSTLHLLRGRPPFPAEETPSTLSPESAALPWRRRNPVEVRHRRHQNHRFSKSSQVGRRYRRSCRDDRPVLASRPAQDNCHQ